MFLVSVSIANEVACKSLDWLETAIPMLHTPTEQVTCRPRCDSQPTVSLPAVVSLPQLVATARKKMAEVQDVVSIAASGSADCVSMGVAWLKVRLEVAQVRGQPLVDGAVAAAAVGLETVLVASEALVDRMLPPTEDDTGLDKCRFCGEGLCR